ncbi:molecular chaperone HtpG [Helicobacter ailurogastricus]|uniref:molecular chaperone HtpG n=1 Tax=Helicobacter ailurogastricus TaxID=1578720 RepID=UPI0022BCFF0A|nr:molecular chaperone HtpG [Helicobacter ailurogastricus]GLH57568.1 Chaperone protein HtpG [Helicobacter ailurogastricus]GLH59943.1 Chaperone protein HtpG [Helicobacter ailurogastricus]GMB90208.1 Chaperone protein HtpG [Helicobacter ailurogastricus]
MPSKKHTFQTEINQLLDLMIHSLYSHKEIFLRELISNASDALDKLNYMIISDEAYKSLEFRPQINLSFNEKAKSLTIADNGIGMSEEELISNLGTIAKSGTKSFLANLSGDQKKDNALIGQFGVGFYSSFMVANKVVVQSKKALSEEAFAWVSDGKGSYEISPCVKEGFGTEITLYLKDEEAQFANRWEIEHIVKKYSEHIPFPIFLSYTETKSEGEGADKKEVTEEKCTQINSAKALWRMPKNELKDEDYKEFYKSFAHDNNAPLAWIHNKAEGVLEYNTLFYIPSVAPFDMFRVDYQSGVKLYVKRVFITDNDKELLPQYLRFVRGIIDSEDLPLNVSREILQQNKILANIKSASTKKILAEIEKLSQDEKTYEKFYTQFGRVLKEGLHSDFENKDKILDLLRFVSNKSEKPLSLKEYKAGMPAEQKSIYYMVGESQDLLKASPILEKYAQKGFDVLLMGDEVDAFVMPGVSEYDKTPLKDAASSETLKELGLAEVSEAEKEEFKGVLEAFKEALKDEVKEVALSKDLHSAVALVGDEQNAMMANLMRQMGQSVQEQPKTLELNIGHAIIQKLKGVEDRTLLADVAHLLFDSAKLLENGALKNAKAFNDRLSATILRAF